MTLLKTRLAIGREAREASVGKVYFSSQDMRVVLPKMPALGYWEAWMCVSSAVLV